MQIHRYRLNGYNIILDVSSGGVHVADELTYELTGMLIPPLEKECPRNISDALSEKYSRDDIKSSYSEIYGLYESGMLFSSDDYGKYGHLMSESPVKAMCINIAHDCNLRCEYCFAAKGDFGHGRELMPLNVGIKAIDFLLEHSKNRRNLEVDFFGGEPLMNFPVVKEIVEYARSKEAEYGKNFRFTLTTNGLLLNDEIIEYINREMSNIVLSLDGRKEVNDRLRLTPGGKGSYDIIVPKYQKLVSGRGDKDYYVRGTFTKHNLDFTDDVLHINGLGFDQVSVEPVVSDKTLDYAIDERDLPEIFDEYERLSKALIKRKREGKGFNFFHFMIDLDRGPCAIKRLRGCGAGNEYIAVTPDGSIYPCHQFVGMDGWRMGSVLDNTLNSDMKRKFAASNVFNKEECKGCWARFYCSGGCNANNHQYEGDVQKPHALSCELQKKRLECAIMMKADEMNSK